MLSLRLSAILIALSCTIFLHSTAIDAAPRRKYCGIDLYQRIAGICEVLGGYNVFRQSHYHHRVRRRVADECCRKPCSDATITKYCTYGLSDKHARSAETESDNNTVENGQISHVIKREANFPPSHIDIVAPEYNKIGINPKFTKILPNSN